MKMHHSEQATACLAESGISVELAAACGIETLSPTEMGVATGYDRWAGLVFPYFDLAGTDTGHRRYRFLGRSGSHKYHTPKGDRSQIYFPPNHSHHPNHAVNTKIPVYITEGEKKAIALQAADQKALVIGLPGVWNYSEDDSIRGKRLHGDLTPLAWKGRDVYIIFDNDGNPHVRYAAARLAGLLTARGASVYNALPVGHKGIDDYLVAGGALEDLLVDARKFAQELESERIPAAVNELNARFCYDRSTGRVLDMDYGIYLRSMAEMQITHPDKIPYAKLNGKTALVPAVKVWAENKFRVEVHGKKFCPEEQNRITADGYYNIYNGFVATPTFEGEDEYVGLWEAMLYGLCWELTEDEAKWFRQRIAWIFQHPGERAQSACILRSDLEGVGKSLLVNTLVRLAGEHGKVLTDASLGSKFNSEYEGALIVHFEEVASGRGIEARSFLKTLITTREITVNRKFVQPYTIQNYTNVFMTSNQAAPLGITSTYDRRMFVLSVPTDTVLLSKADFARLAAWLATPTGLGRILGWLLATPTGDFEPGSPPPATAAKSAVVAASQPAVVQWAASVTAREARMVDASWPTGARIYWDQEEGQEVVTGTGLLAAAHAHLRECGAGGMGWTDKALLHRLTQAGLLARVPSRSGDGRWHVGDGRRATVYAFGAESVAYWNGRTVDAFW